MDKITVTFVCTGNTCRSPMAEGIFKKISYAKLPQARVQSVGLSTVDGLPVTDKSVTACAEIGIDISHHTSKQIDLQTLQGTDIFFVMTASHALALQNMGVSESKIYIPNAVADPYGADIEVYRKCRDMLITECEKFLKQFESRFMQIIPMTTGNIPVVAELERTCFAHPYTEQMLAESLVMDNTRYFVATVGSEVLGYIGMEVPADEGYIFNVAVFPQYRKNGIGKALIDYLADFGVQNNLYMLTLEVRESNIPAINLYQKCGFEKVGQRKNYYSSPTEDAILMTKFFGK